MAIIEAIKRIISGFRYALLGLWHIVRVERNARIHLVSAILVLSAAVFFGLTNGEMAAIFFAVILVFLAEVLNTALEKTLDLIEPQFNDKVAIIKDMAAGAVLVAAGGAAFIGIVIFWPYIIALIWKH